MQDVVAHVLLLPYPAQGHVNPLVELAKRLAAAGMRVTLATVSHIHAKLLRSQLIHDSHVDFQLMSLPADSLAPDFNRHLVSSQAVRDTIERDLEEGALEVIHTLALQGRPVTCIVGDFFLCWPCSLAEKTALPEFIFWPQCASIFSIYLHLDTIIAAGYDPFEANVAATAARPASMELLSCIPGLTLKIHPGDLPFESPAEGKEEILAWVRDILRRRFSNLGKAQGVIANSFESLEPDAFQALSNQCLPRLIRLVGPLVRLPSKSAGGSSSLYWEEQVEECVQWLDLQPPSSVLFVAFGSVTAVTIAQMHEIAWGLSMSGHRFLWVIRHDPIKPAQDTESVELQDVLPDGFLELHKHICKVVRWAPQALVLSHPSVRGFFSHCGWNSTLESICAGVPILGWPWVTDQVTNCWLVSHVWKVGLTLKRDEDNRAARGDVDNGVRQLMEGPHAREMRARAIKLRDLAQEAVLHNESLNLLVDDICKASHCETICHQS